MWRTRKLFVVTNCFRSCSNPAGYFWSMIILQKCSFNGLSEFIYYIIFVSIPFRVFIWCVYIQVDRHRIRLLLEWRVMNYSLFSNGILRKKVFVIFSIYIQINKPFAFFFSINKGKKEIIAAFIKENDIYIQLCQQKLRCVKNLSNVCLLVFLFNSW